MVLEDGNGSAVNHQAQERDWNQKGKNWKKKMDGFGGVGGGRVMDTVKRTGGGGGAFQMLPYFCWGSSRAWRRTWTVACLLQSPRVWAGWPLTQSICLRSQESATQMFTQVIWLRGRGGTSVASCVTLEWCLYKHTPTHCKGKFLCADRVYSNIHCFTVHTRIQCTTCSLQLTFRYVGRHLWHRTCVKN